MYIKSDELLKKVRAYIRNWKWQFIKKYNTRSNVEFKIYDEANMANALMRCEIIARIENKKLNI